MQFDVPCNMCGATLQVDESQVGTITKCLACGQAIFVSQSLSQPQPDTPDTELVHTLGASEELGPPTDLVLPEFTPETTDHVPVSASESRHPRSNNQQLVAPVVTSTPQNSPKTKSPVGAYVGIYISGAIFGLILGKFLFSRPVLTGLELIRDDGANRYKTEWVSPTAPVPSSQRKGLGETIRLGDLSVTALAVEKRSIELARVDPFSGEVETMRSPQQCLVLRVRLKNTSANVQFAPLDETFLRPHDPTERPTYSFIEQAGGDRISLYELAPFSEWSIVGQPCSAIKPGEQLDAIIPAANGSADQARGKILWRLQLRAGGPVDEAFSTVVGFDLDIDQVCPSQAS